MANILKKLPLVVYIKLLEIRLNLKKKVDQYNWNYESASTPHGYVCSDCKASGCKLWRNYNAVLSAVVLRCGQCALKNQNEQGPLNEDGTHFSPKINMQCDQIGWLVPAIPTEENDTYWGYTSVPQVGVLWWKRLPLKT